MSQYFRTIPNDSVDVWLVIGTRRWARILALELCQIMPDNKVILLLRNDTGDEIENWINQNGLGHRITLITEIPPCKPFQVAVAFIANSAYLHYEYSTRALKLGYHIICEKPITLTRDQAISLLDLARLLNLQLFSSNVYLFSHSIQIAASNWLSVHNLIGVSLIWADSDTGDGDYSPKKYDSSVPIIMDVLPHVSNILDRVLGDVDLNLELIKVGGGGGRVYLRYGNRSFKVRIQLIRNHSDRIRLMIFRTKDRTVYLDLDRETIRVVQPNNHLQPLNLSGTKVEKPLQAMLRSVCEFFSSGRIDDRLSSNHAIKGLSLIESAMAPYVQNQVANIQKYRVAGQSDRNSKERNYICKEIDGVVTRLSKSLPPDHVLLELSKHADWCRTLVK